MVLSFPAQRGVDMETLEHVAFAHGDRRTMDIISTMLPAHYVPISSRKFARMTPGQRCGYLDGDLRVLIYGRTALDLADRDRFFTIGLATKGAPRDVDLLIPPVFLCIGLYWFAHRFGLPAPLFRPHRIRREDVGAREPFRADILDRQREDPGFAEDLFRYFRKFQMAQTRLPRKALVMVG